MKINFAYLVNDITTIAYPSIRDYVNKEMDENKVAMTYGVAWAKEIYDRLNESADKGEYWQTLQSFTREKLTALIDEQKNAGGKVAKLVYFEICSRVVVDENEMKECEDEDAINKALVKIKKDIDGYLCFDNFVYITEDEECPYGTLSEDKENE